LPGVCLPRRAKPKETLYGIHSAERDESGIALGWEDIKNLQLGTVTKTFTDDTLPGGPNERTITYVAPFDKCDRKADYAIAWHEFEKRKTEK
jgi:hypothetical protein